MIQLVAVNRFAIRIDFFCCCTKQLTYRICYLKMIFLKHEPIHRKIVYQSQALLAFAGAGNTKWHIEPLGNMAVVTLPA